MLGNQEYDLGKLSPDELVAQPRSKEELDFWFNKVGPKRFKWKGAQAQSMRLQMAMQPGQNRQRLLQRYIEKKPTRVDFNTAHVAAILGTPEAMALAKARNADFSEVWNKRTCLMLAAELGHAQFVRTLLDDGVPYTTTVGNMNGVITPLALAIKGGHPAVVAGLAKHAVPTDLGRAISKGDLETIALLQQHVEEPEGFFCPDQNVALQLWKHFPSLSPGQLAARGSGVALAEAIVARHPTLAPQEIAPHLKWMQLEGLEILFEACANLGKKFELGGVKESLISCALSARAEVVQALEARGETVAKKVDLTNTLAFPDDVRLYVLHKRRGLSDAEFFDIPFAEGFAGRFSASFFGVEFGNKRNKSIKIPGLKQTTDANGLVTGLSFTAYDIPGDAFSAVSAELDMRFGSERKVDHKGHRIWQGDGLDVSLREAMEDPGLKLTLTVDTVAKAGGSDPGIEALTEAFSMLFSELESVNVRRVDDGGYTFSGNKVDSDAGVCVTWPRSPLKGDRSWEEDFLDKALQDLRNAEETFDDDF